MGSPNFSITTGSGDVRGLAWGLVPSYPTDEDVQEEIDNGDWEDTQDTDNIREYLYQDNIDDVNDMYRPIKEAVGHILDEARSMWEERNGFDWDVFPYDIKLEQGYHEGFSVGIVDKFNTGELVDTTKYYKTVWDHYASWDRYFQSIEMSYENYWRAVDAVADFMQWALDQMARCYALQLVTGCGWIQGTADYSWDEYKSHHKATKWAEQYPQINHELCWDEFGSIKLRGNERTRG